MLICKIVVMFIFDYWLAVSCLTLCLWAWCDLFVWLYFHFSLPVETVMQVIVVCRDLVKGVCVLFYAV